MSKMKLKFLTLILLAGLAFGLSGNAVASPQAFYNGAPGHMMLVGFWAVGFGSAGVSTEFSVFADRTNTTFAMPIQIVFIDDKQARVTEHNDELTAEERKHYDAEALLIGTSAKVGFMLVADTSLASSVLSGAVVIGLDTSPGASVEGSAKLLLDTSGNVISTARSLTGHKMQYYATSTISAPLGLTTCPNGVAGCTKGDGFQTFLVILNAGTISGTKADQSVPIDLEFFGDNEEFLGSCDTILTDHDMWVTRVGLSPGLNDVCIPSDFNKALVGTAKTTARWAASVRTKTNNSVLLGEVFTVNTRSLEAYAYEMSQATDTSNLQETVLTSLLTTI
jgi:hypothetical protein